MGKFSRIMLILSIIFFSACSQKDAARQPKNEEKQSSHMSKKKEGDQLAANYPGTLLAWIYQDEAFCFDYEEFTVDQYNKFVSTENNTRGTYVYNPQQSAAVHVTYEMESIAKKISNKIDRKEVVKDGTFLAIAVPNREIVFSTDEQLANSRWHRVPIMNYLNLKGFQRTNGGNEKLPNDLKVRYHQYENSEGKVIKLYLDEAPQLYGVGISNINRPEEEQKLFIISNVSQTIPEDLFKTDDYAPK
ncbi:hypothetical protein [Enterococcus sp. AZ163]|uniref:hypothetical protein n=1 Tax=Enterococcus sp. AZ163 TaxID=2774638 RepID=UPI003D27D619